MLKLNTHSKTSILLLSAFLVLIIIFSSFVYFSISNYLHLDFYKLLHIRATAYAQIYAEPENTPAEMASQSAYLREEIADKLRHEKDYIFRTTSGQTNFKSFADSLKIPEQFFREVVNNGDAEFETKNILYKGILHKTNNASYLVIASAENAFESRLTNYLLRTLLLAIVISLVFAAIISVYTSLNIFKPLSRITQRVRQMSSENLHMRLNADEYYNEFNLLAATFNEMLNRIEMAFETQNNFISNASHELRTPLTGIIGTADVCLSKIRSTDEYIETIKIILDEAEKLDLKTKALLFLAQTGFDGKSQKFKLIRIDQLIFDVIATIEKLDKRNKVHIDTSLLPESALKLKVNGNEQLLHLALSNIINNACKYSNYNPVNVSIGASNDRVFIVVKDTGIGIPEDELRYIYDPFFRASNTKKFEGYGIGLPLTNNIIKMHAGKIIVSSMQDKGTVVQIDLPVCIVKVS